MPELNPEIKNLSQEKQSDEIIRGVLLKLEKGELENFEQASDYLKKEKSLLPRELRIFAKKEFIKSGLDSSDGRTINKIYEKITKLTDEEIVFVSGFNIGNEEQHTL